MNGTKNRSTIQAKLKVEIPEKISILTPSTQSPKKFSAMPASTATTPLTLTYLEFISLFSIWHVALSATCAHCMKFSCHHLSYLNHLSSNPKYISIKNSAIPPRIPSSNECTTDIIFPFTKHSGWRCSIFGLYITAHLPVNTYTVNQIVICTVLVLQP